MRSLRNVVIATSMLVVACGGNGGGGGGNGLLGTFRFERGECSAGSVTKGSYFRMIQPGGTPAAGPYVDNGDSPCGDKTFTPMTPGTDGGLVTGVYQATPESPFDDKGNGVASRVAEPTTWFGVKFSVATNPKDPQVGADVGTPRITVSGAALGGDVRAFAAAWNGQHFNQGSPKPDGSKPGHTTGPSGTYDAGSRRFVLEWTSQIVGGPFNNFTGMWHFEGTFEPKP